MSSLPEQAVNPPYVDAPYREIEDEDSIAIAMAEVDHLEESLIFLDRRIFPNSHFTSTQDIYKALQVLRKELREMLGEE